MGLFPTCCQPVGAECSHCHGQCRKAFTCCLPTGLAASLISCLRCSLCEMHVSRETTSLWVLFFFTSDHSKKHILIMTSYVHRPTELRKLRISGALLISTVCTPLWYFALWLIASSLIAWPATWKHVALAHRLSYSSSSHTADWFSFTTSRFYSR